MAAEDTWRTSAWIAECIRDRGICPYTDSPTFGELTAVARFEGTLQYEPRSLAISPSGRSVAVGTKSGHLHLFSWDNEAGRWQSAFIEPLSPTDTGDDPSRMEHDSPPNGKRRALRGLAYLGPDLLLVGWGQGATRVLDTARGSLSRPLSAPQAPAGVDQWRVRFRKVVSLVGNHQPENDSVVAIGLTPTRWVHVIRRRNGEIENTLETSPKLFGVNARVVDAALHGDGESIWLLGDDGQLTRVSLSLLWHSKGETSAHTAPVEAHRFGPQRPPVARHRPNPRGISVCTSGIGLWYGSEVTFAPFVGTNTPQLTGIQWVSAPRIMAFAAFNVYDRDEADIVVSTEDAGLRWIPWRIGEGAAHPLRRNERHSQPERIRSTVLQIGAGNATPMWLRRESDDAGPGSLALDGAELQPRQPIPAPFLATTTRDHKVRIASILHLKKLNEQLDRDNVQEIREAPPGLALHKALSLIDSLMKRTQSTDTNTLLKLIGALSYSDLHEILHHLKQRWQGLLGDDRLADDADGGAPRVRIYRRVVLRCLMRGAAIDRRGLPALVQRVYDDVEDLQGNVGTLEQDQLVLFGAFLRKWFLFGYTYSEKQADLAALYSWNHRSHRMVDALFYLTRLLRRRVDQQWMRDVPSLGVNPAVWALAAPEDTQFHIHTHTDGRILATDAHGQPLHWHSCEDLEKHSHLKVEPDGRRTALIDLDANEFRDRYRHGPYVRRVAVAAVPQASANRYILVFGMRGWKSGDKKQRGPRIVALFVQLTPGNATANGQLEILSVSEIQVSTELYAVHYLPVPLSDPEHGNFEFIVGTSGSWQIGEENEAPPPFYQIEAVVGGTDISLRNVQPTIEEDPRWASFGVFRRDHAALELGSNACWSAATVQSKEPGGREAATWLVLGMQNGLVRFLRWGSTGCWREHGLLFPIETHSPVWNLCLLEAKNETHRSFLAYGTADGVIGTVALDRLFDHETAHSQDRLPWAHIVHTRQAGSICGLSQIDDDGEVRLVAVTDAGSAIIFSIAPAKETLPGRRLAHFRLPLQPRALTAGTTELDIPGLGPLRCPSFVIGDNQGHVSKHALAFPKKTKRREEGLELAERLMHDQLEPATHPKERAFLVRALGNDRSEIYRWLRLCDVREHNLMRFALWAELEDPSNPDFIDTLQTLSAEIAELPDVGANAAKVLWEKAADRATTLGRKAISELHEDSSPKELVEYQTLLVEIDNIVNRWIGADKDEEARVLMHSFAHLFGSEAVAIISHPLSALDLGSELRNELASTRSYLLRNVISRRFRHANSLVPLETLRVINEALFHRLATQSDETRDQPEHRSGVRGEPGYWDLLILVGHLARQHGGRLSPADPLFTEIARLLALSILLIPNGVRAIGQIVSESRLAEHAADVARRVVVHLNAFTRDLPNGSSTERTKALGEFVDYLSPEVDRNARHRSRGESTPWSRALARPAAPGAPYLSDEHFANEQRLVIEAVLDLMDLDRPQEGGEKPELLQRTKEDIDYFQESFEYIGQLAEEHTRLLQRIKDNDNPDEPYWRDLRAALEDHPNIVEPQKSHYRALIEGWRTHFERQGTRAQELITLIEKFNRHVYRTSADDLLASLTELAMRSSPVSLDKLMHAQSLRPEIQNGLKPFPFLDKLYERGLLLVQRSHLAATLLHLARPRSEGATAYDSSISLGRICGLAKEIAPLENLVHYDDRHGSGPRVPADKVSVPGDEFVWRCFVQEIASNVARYRPQKNAKELSAFCDVARVPKDQLNMAWHRGSSHEYVAFGGCCSFAGILTKEKRDEVTAEELMRMVQALTTLDKEPMPISIERSSGYGLFFLDRLCHLLGIRASVVLDHPCQLHDYVSEPTPDNPSNIRWRHAHNVDQLAKLPLTIVFSWRHKEVIDA